MLAKLLLIILWAGSIAAALLVNRQRRIETFHEMTVTHQRLLEHETTLWRLRSDIAQRCRPSHLRVVMERMGMEWEAIPAASIPRAGASPPPALLTNRRVVTNSANESSPSGSVGNAHPAARFYLTASNHDAQRTE